MFMLAIHFVHQKAFWHFARRETSNNMKVARNLDKIDDESFDLIASHYPYASIISYTKNKKFSAFFRNCHFMIT